MMPRVEQSDMWLHCFEYAILVYLTAKEMHIFNIHLIPLYLIKFYPNDMSMFEWTHAFVPDHFIRHNTVNYYFMLINAKNATTMLHIGKHMISIRFHCMSR